MQFEITRLQGAKQAEKDDWIQFTAVRTAIHSLISIP
jgi:hypothetical protein